MTGPGSDPVINTTLRENGQVSRQNDLLPKTFSRG